MRHHITSLAFAFAVTLGFAASGTSVDAAGVAGPALRQVPAQTFEVDRVGYRHYRQCRPRVYFSPSYRHHYSYYYYVRPRSYFYGYAWRPYDYNYYYSYRRHYRYRY